LCFILTAGCRYLVDTVAGDPEVLQADAETYYEKLLKQSSSAPDIFSIPGGEKVISCCFSFYKLDICKLVRWFYSSSVCE